MSAQSVEKGVHLHRDIAFLGVIALCVFLALGAIHATWKSERSVLPLSGPRQVDVSKIKRQISEGHLSPQKALYQKKLPR